MGHHIDEQGRFRSDKHPELPPDKVIIDLTDPEAHDGLLVIAEGYRKRDFEFAADLDARVRQLQADAVGTTRCDGAAARARGTAWRT